MRTTIAFIFMVLMAALVGCAVVASRVEKPIAVPVRRLLLALLPPVFGNFLIILSGEPMLATIGCYTYYIGMDVMMMALFYFTSDYCNLGLSKSKLSAVCPGIPNMRSAFRLRIPASSSIRQLLTKSPYLWIRPRDASSSSEAD